MAIEHFTLQKTSGRLASLDVLRGFDLFMLVFFSTRFRRVGKALGTHPLFQVHVAPV